jgi:hypothetical protein
VRQFIAAFNDGIYSVPSKCREINFTKQGGNKLPHSKERCHARKSKIHSNIFEITFTFPFEVRSSMLNVQIVFTSLFVIRMFGCWIFFKNFVPLCLCAFVPLCLCASVPLCLCASVPLCLCAFVPLCLCASVPLCLCASVPLCLCASVPLCLCAFVPLCLCAFVPLCLCAFVPL